MCDIISPVYTFGRYKGCTWEHVIEVNPHYFVWTYNHIDSVHDHPMVDHFIGEALDKCRGVRCHRYEPYNGYYFENPDEYWYGCNEFW